MNTEPSWKINVLSGIQKKNLRKSCRQNLVVIININSLYEGSCTCKDLSLNDIALRCDAVKKPHQVRSQSSVNLLTYVKTLIEVIQPTRECKTSRFKRSAGRRH